MTIPAAGGEIAVALQPGKVGRKGTYNPDALEFYKLRAPRVAFGEVQDQQIFPWEVGGANVPTGAFKQGVFVAGAIDLIPRLKEAFGIFLLSAMGSVEIASGTNSNGDAVAGLNTHVFNFSPDSAFYQPWLSVRRMVPGRTLAENSGVTGFDVKVNSLAFTIPAAGKVQARVSLLGRDFKLSDSSTWVYENASYENDASTSEGGRGLFKIGGIEYPIMSAAIEMANNLTPPQQEMIIGSFRPDDFVALTRGMTIRAVYKYENDDLCRRIYAGGPDSVDWSSEPFYTITEGDEYGFEAYFQSGGQIPGSSPLSEYGIRFTANRVTWAMDGPPELAGGSFVAVTLIGTVLEPDSGAYATISIENENDGSTYDLPALFTLTFADDVAYSGSIVALDATATFADVAAISSFNGGKVTLSYGIPVVGALDAASILSIATAGGITLAGNVVSHSATPIGTYSGGTYAENLVVTLNAAATAASIQALIRAFRYNRTGGANGAEFPVRLTVQDASGNTVSDIITIEHS
jgi:hypothetical protein